RLRRSSLGHFRPGGKPPPRAEGPAPCHPRAVALRRPAPRERARIRSVPTIPRGALLARGVEGFLGHDDGIPSKRQQGSGRDLPFAAGQEAPAPLADVEAGDGASLADLVIAHPAYQVASGGDHRAARECDALLDQERPKALVL